MRINTVLMSKTQLDAHNDLILNFARSEPGPFLQVLNPIPWLLSVKSSNSGSGYVEKIQFKYHAEDRNGEFG